MDLFRRLLAAEGTPAATDDFWYRPVGEMTAAGLRIDRDGAKKISAWYRGRDILATVLAMLPLQIMQVLADDMGSEPAPDHPLYDLVHAKPNPWQDSFQWRRQQMYGLIDCGNAYNLIKNGRRGAVDEMHPVDPRTVTVVQIGSGRLVYRVKDARSGLVTSYAQDQVFHLRGASDDGITGKGILEYARTTLGTASATEGYAASIFGAGTLNGGIIETPATLDDEASKRMAQSFLTAAGNWHLPKVLEQGAKFVPNELTPEDAQMLLSRKFNVDDIARWLGVPRLMLENADPSYGNAEQFTQNFLDYNMGPWLSLWEYAINDQLILAPKKYFARFTRQALVRSNFKERIDGLTSFVNAGVMTVDEARTVEDLPKRGGKADELREPQNITGKPAAGAPDAPPEPTPAPKPPQPANTGKASLIAQESAARLLRKEVAEVQKLAVKHALSSAVFEDEVTAFYRKHVDLVSMTLLLLKSEAHIYCANQCAQVLENWTEALAKFKTPDYAAGLAELALEDAA